MQNAIPEALDIDDNRVNRIRVQLDDNSYTVNTRQIADKIIAIEVALCDAILAASGLVHNA